MAKFTRVSVWLLASALIAPGFLASLQAQVIEEGKAVGMSRGDPGKVILGVVEDVVLAPWGISFPARIDTGADLSSLDARDIVVRNDIAEFRLGSQPSRQRVQLPIIDWGRVQTSMGVEKRPIVAVSICLGSKLLRTPVTLRDRSGMTYPFLVGRSALNGTFLVDSSRSRAAAPDCPANALTSN